MKPEKDLISRSALLAQMAKRLPVEDDISDVVTNCVRIARRLVEKAPAVEAVEVVHGQWTFKHNPLTDPKKYFIRIVCSECNLHTGQKSNYCPNCGARMDGDGDG